MAEKFVNIGPFGPFIYDDIIDKGVETDGDVKASGVQTTGLTTNIRLILSDANQKVAEVNNLTQFISGSNQINVADDGDGTITITAKNLIEINDIVGGDSPYDISITAYRSMVIVNASANAVTVNLPPAANWAGQTIIVKKTDNVNNVTIQADGTETIDDNNTDQLVGQYSSATYVSDGTNVWKVGAI